MFHRVDSCLIDKLDKATTWAQRRGILLTHIHVAACGATMITNVALQGTDSLFGFFWAGFVWGAWLFAYIKWADQNKDYPTVVRKMERLNAEAVVARDLAFMRFLWWTVWPIQGGLNVIGGFANNYRFPWLWALLSIASVITPTLMWYLNCCIYLGPGEFAKQKQKQTQDNFAHHEI